MALIHERTWLQLDTWDKPYLIDCCAKRGSLVFGKKHITVVFPFTQGELDSIIIGKQFTLQPIMKSTTTLEITPLKAKTMAKDADGLEGYEFNHLDPNIRSNAMAYVKGSSEGESTPVKIVPLAEMRGDNCISIDRAGMITCSPNLIRQKITIINIEILFRDVAMTSQEDIGPNITMHSVAMDTETGEIKLLTYRNLEVQKDTLQGNQTERIVKFKNEGVEPEEIVLLTKASKE